MQQVVPHRAAVLLVIVLVVTANAISTWRGFAEHERVIENLRQAHAGPHLYRQVVSGESTPDADIAAFGHVCEHVLGVQVACLWPLGPLSSLLRPLSYPPDTAFPAGVPALAGHFTSSKTLCAPLDPTEYAGAMWVVPLWGEHGLTGLLLLGPKRSRGLYTQEEIEVARATGERLLDSLASAELARRLVQLQRTRMVEGQVIDQRTRRALHDEVLPQVHATMLALSAGQLETSQVMAHLTDIHGQIANILHAMPTAGVAVIATKGLVAALRQFAEEDCRGAFQTVQWEIDKVAAARIAELPSLTAEVFYGAAREAVRNAARHAAGDAPEKPVNLLVAASCHDGLRLIIEDDGAGIGAPSPALAGAGHGMALHSTMMAVIGGSWETESQPGAFTRITLSLPANT